jgi:NADPH2:quinone reductase
MPAGRRRIAQRRALPVSAKDTDASNVVSEDMSAGISMVRAASIIGWRAGMVLALLPPMQAAPATACRAKVRRQQRSPHDAATGQEVVLKAVVVSRNAPFEEIEIGQLPDPVPGPGEVVVDVAAAEANYPDILAIEGRYQIKPPLPFSPGKSAAGRISAVGEGVSTFKTGDFVSVQVEYGAYAEKLRVAAAHCFHAPAGIPAEKAAALGLVYQTAWFALKDRASFKPGEIVLVLGASGGVGVASVQLAKALGARMVIAGVLGAENAKVAREAGADHVIELGDPELRESLRRQVAEFTGGHGVDVVIDPVGGDANAAALRAMAWCGRLVVIGFASGTIPAIKANYLLVKNIAVSGLQWSDYRDRTPERMQEAQREIFEFYVNGKIDPMISRVLPLAEFKEALRSLRDGKAQGKIILSVRPS